ncbi:MAG: peptidoglycan editing factor PgeF [Bacteroidota bacterium]
MQKKVTSNTTFLPAFSQFPALIAAQSTRHGGISPTPYASLNLSLHTDDHPNNVAINRQRFFEHLGIPMDRLAYSHQVHGHQVAIVDQAGALEGYDALISRQKGLFLCVTIADCLPILVYDPVQNGVAAIHAGWRGTVGRIVEKTLQLMIEHWGSRVADCFAYLGTAIDECSFEVDEDVARQFQDSHQRWDEKRGKYLIDLKKANMDQLLGMGFKRARISQSPYSTYLDNEHFFSYRKEGITSGRMLAVIGIRQ